MKAGEISSHHYNCTISDLPVKTPGARHSLEMEDATF